MKVARNERSCSPSWLVECDVDEMGVIHDALVLYAETVKVLSDPVNTYIWSVSNKERVGKIRRMASRLANAIE